jgi:hypothetical protein
MSYVLRPTSERDRARLSKWDRPTTRLDWQIVWEGDNPSLCLHGCDLVRDWDRPSGWKLPKEHRAALHDDLSALLPEFDAAVLLTATWTDDSIDIDEGISRAEALERVATNRIANRTVYRISG